MTDTFSQRWRYGILAFLVSILSTVALPDWDFWRRFVVVVLIGAIWIFNDYSRRDSRP